MGIAYQKEIQIPLRFRSTTIQRAFRLDILVEENVILEIKSIDSILPVHEAQLLTCLKLTGKPVGLLINFHVPLLKQGIRRFVFTQKPLVPLESGSKSDVYAEVKQE